MKRIGLALLVFCLLVLSNSAWAAWDKTLTITVNQRSGWVDNFQIGSAQLKDHHKKELRAIANDLLDNPILDVVMKGSYSSESIRHGCYVAIKGEAVIFSLNPFANSTKYEDEDTCQHYLGQARAHVSSEYVMSFGVESKRIHVLDAVDSASRNDHAKDRAISYWLVDVPNGYFVASVYDDNDVAFVLLEREKRCQFNVKNIWQRIKNVFSLKKP